MVNVQAGVLYVWAYTFSACNKVVEPAGRGHFITRRKFIKLTKIDKIDQNRAKRSL
jgi:hypothetical protein